MKKQPNSKNNLDRSILRYAQSDIRAVALRTELANVIVAQMIGDGVVKGGTGLKFRYGDLATRVTTDLDTAYRQSLDSFIVNLKKRLADGWSGFTGELWVRPMASPKGIPFDYVMQPCDVKLSYLGTSWFTVALEIGHNEIGDADSCDEVVVPAEIAGLLDHLALPSIDSLRVMKLEYQIAQKLHGATGLNSDRAHDLIDLQLILAHTRPDFATTRAICQKLFAYRKCQSWPAIVVKNEKWETVYEAQKGDLPVLPTVDEAVAWANDLIARIDAAKEGGRITVLRARTERAAYKLSSS